MNENPLVRYYQPIDHGPLGPLASTSAEPSNSSSYTPTFHSPNAAPPPSEGGLRWARQAALRATEAASATASGLVSGAAGVNALMADGLPKRLATAFQQELDEYRKSNPDWPVGIPSAPSL